MTAQRPSSTYRLQISPDFALADAARVLHHLDRLGVGAVYCSPLLQSADGSGHGYDVVDVTRVDEARGGEDGWRAFLSAARGLGLGVVVDIVPNHLGVAGAVENPAWWDVLRHGRNSRYAAWFDIEWARGRILLPVLGPDADPATDLTVADGELCYFEHRFPLAPGTGPGPADSPADVHDRQHYQLVDSRRADTDQNYRRFFAVSTLAGVRVEDPAVATATHERVLAWVRDDEIDGLRVDHPDGLADPAAYFTWLRSEAPDAWLTAEKILEPGEALPARWPVDGTTGYDALAEVGPLFVDPRAEPAFDRLYRDVTGDHLDFAGHVQAGKRLVATTILRAEIRRLARLVPSVPRAVEALTELAVAFPVYRSYLPDGAENLAGAVRLACRRRPELAEAVASLLPRLTDPADELCVRFQQTTGAVMAKGVEDTAYYRYARFVALNEVGGDPSLFGLDLDEFHDAQRLRQANAPYSMTTLSTHDTKRGEDVRAWLAVLSELPDEWAVLVRHLSDTAPMPHAALGYLLWQCVVGVGLDQPARLHAYAEKAMREAADGTGWAHPDEKFEHAVHAALDALHDEPRLRSQIDALRDRIRPFGWSNALAQKLIQLTMPGIPDVYRGTEGWEDSLVDPDNRRPVDFTALRSLLEVDQPPVDATGAAKAWIVSRALRLRRDRPELFRGYEPVPVTGPKAEHAVAFDRGGSITVAARLPVALRAGGGWTGTAIDLPAGLVDLLTGRPMGGRTPLDELLTRYPVALLAPV
ncbi:malto-oligosyltrehalose synthase [Phytoactinopolyspora alkaliphila]|uniref:Malto-oligosyltrehalose synthase n=1 Tax=Phytoactinopolyspora alkaliphila TaxID=1783498 RepID=A0A6N9YGL4_9ACTN|nr:malto-oligosyltrehalose synthase [Phytoactinopolyspora alkaliphila]NED94055.1 malto-oligosyltrehalose synthase [Phytoactinopolyspora alkaliphila]